MDYISLFSGIGGFDLALNSLGHTCVGYSEIEKSCIAIYKHNFGTDIENFGDITQIDETKLPDCELIVGGFPCQDFSRAGPRKGLGGSRGKLFFDIMRIVKRKAPRYILLENVKGLVGGQSRPDFAIILEEIRKLGYNVEFGVLNVRTFGIPQYRERVFIIGYIGDRPSGPVFPIVRDGELLIRGKGLPYSTALSRTYFKGHDQHAARTLIEQNGHIRMLTTTECERLMGFPDDWTKYGDYKGVIKELKKSPRYKCLGNAVCPLVVKTVAKRLLKK